MRKLEASRRQPANIRVARRLGVAIVTGTYEIGAILPGEIELARTLDVSRSVLREALRMLASKGMLDSRPKTGTRVRARSDWNLLDPELLGWMFESIPPVGFVRDLFELRLIVEPAAAALAAVRRDARQLAAMGDALERMAEYGLQNEKGRKGDERFHVLILEAAGNELIGTLSAGIAAAVRWTTFFKARSGLELADPLPHHFALFEAIAAANPDAARTANVALLEFAHRDTEVALDALTDAAR